MTTEPDPSDDYSYDLAHEVSVGMRVPTATRHQSPAPTPPAPDPADDPDGFDLGYDDAHGL
jgi:hypothetical protein